MTQETELAKRPVNYLPDRAINKEQAMYLLKTIWPNAPETEVIKAGILCQQYGLNPLMRQVYLVQFGKEWVTILGIKATRQIAQQALRKRGIRYSYDDGPRLMSEKEQVKIRGKVESDKLCAITILRDNDGNQYPGYGWWPADKQPYGADKGNEPLNMAFIRSERNALDKLAPGELPDIEVGDDTYIQGDYKLALGKGKETFHKQVKQDIKDLWPEGGTEPASSTLGSGKKTGIEVQSGGDAQPEQEEAPETGGNLPDEPSPLDDSARLLTNPEMSHLYQLLADHQMEVKALGKWLKEQGIPVPGSIAKLTKESYDKIVGAFEKGA